MTKVVADYLDLVIAEHRAQPNLIATLTELVSWSADIQALMDTYPALFDVDTAVGQQLDVIGEWVGVSRNVNVPLTGIYFSLDSAPLGLDLGSMQGPGDPTSGLIVLPDDGYRTLIRATIARNRWDGSIPAAYNVWDIAFQGTGFGILIQDLGGMQMIYALTGPIPDALTLALFTSGLLTLRPEGVQVTDYITPFTPNTPYFALDADSPFLAGLDVGEFGVETPGA